MLKKFAFGLVPVLLSLSWFVSCSDNDSLTAREEVLLRKRDYATENVVLVVIDGPRYSDTWGMEGRPNIPYMAGALSAEGTFFENFRNGGSTYTLPGHTAITTGNYQKMANGGDEIPLKPSIFQHFLEQTKQAPSKASIVTSKAKLKVLADSRESDWRGRFNPDFNCGKAGENRPDAETYLQAVQTLKENRPNLMLVQFLGPDAHGHGNNWADYLEALQETDSLVNELYHFIQEDEHYRGKTALLITNDHGRHANGHKDGFISHGDGCPDCRHISLLALGPDFGKGKVVKDSYEQIDLAPTIGTLLGIELPHYGGKPILPLLKK